MSAIYDYKTRTGIRCEVYGCRNMAIHYIGHRTHRHTGYNMCDECWNQIYASYAAVKGEAAKVMQEEKIAFEKRQIEAKQRKLYWNDRSKKARLMHVAKQLGIDTRDDSADDGHMTRPQIMEKLREAIPECEQTGNFDKEA